MTLQIDSALPLASGVGPRQKDRHQLNYPLLIGVPLLALVIAVFVIELADIDRQLASLIYQWGDNSWYWRRHPVTSRWIHDHGRHLVTALTVISLALLASSFLFAGIRPGRRVFTYLLLAPTASTLLIQTLKHRTMMDCPYNIDLFGGSNAYFTLWQARPPGNIDHYCFPAGHASAGYCWVALFFVLHYLPAQWRSRYRWIEPRYGLLFGLLLGLLFGIGQQLRGAHFLSHDLWTATLCWGVSALLAYFLLERTEQKKFNF